jgi:hypothetical protein
MFTTIKKDVTATFSSITVRGDIQYDASQHALAIVDPNEPAEIITVNLSAYGLMPPEGSVFIKDWSESIGLTDSLVAAGVVEIVAALQVGPFNSRAYAVRVIAAEAVEPAAAIQIREASL